MRHLRTSTSSSSARWRSYYSTASPRGWRPRSWPRDIFGKVNALRDHTQGFMLRTKTLSQLLRLKQATLKEAMQSRPEDNVIIIKNFIKHQVEIHGMKVEDLLGDNTGEHDDANVLTVAAMGNSSLLEDLLKVGNDADIGKRTHTHTQIQSHIATYKGYEDCELHACNTNIQDAQGSTAMWHAVAAEHHKIFSIMYHFACVSNPHAGGDVLCFAARRNDLGTLWDGGLPHPPGPSL
ncbi:hypothetical protein U9M48_044105 [Paspalum notatum var. saurae]|uniref:Uncharacterized protein n=1 Tax=Paspalum notatum var. saurae TaxID=547442 RepID=A0AAQ3UYK3_PASNO